jgi:RNA polymerase sigma factor (sigma-70 family)
VPEPSKTDPVSLLPIVRGVAASFARFIPRPYDLGDAISAGTIAALEAVRTFDPSKNDNIEAWATILIKYRLKDWLRSIDRLGRDHRKRVNGTLWEPREFSLDAGPLDFIEISDPRADFITKIIVDDLLRCLTEREVKIIRAYYWDGLEMWQIGLLEHVNESRISQILSRAKAKMLAGIKCR